MCEYSVALREEVLKLLIQVSTPNHEISEWKQLFIVKDISKWPHFAAFCCPINIIFVTRAPRGNFHLSFIQRSTSAFLLLLCCLLEVKLLDRKWMCGGDEWCCESDMRDQGEKWLYTVEICHEDKWPVHRTWVKTFLWGRERSHAPEIQDFFFF